MCVTSASPRGARQTERSKSHFSFSLCVSRSLALSPPPPNGSYHSSIAAAVVVEALKKKEDTETTAAAGRIAAPLPSPRLPSTVGAYLQLLKLLALSRFSVKEFWTWGFPQTNPTRMLQQGQFLLGSLAK